MFHFLLFFYWNKLALQCCFSFCCGGGLVTKLCPTLLQAHGLYSPPGSSVHGILQARVLEWVAVFFSKGSSWPRDQTQVLCITGRFFIDWATRGSPSFCCTTTWINHISKWFHVSKIKWLKILNEKPKKKKKKRQASHSGETPLCLTQKTTPRYWWGQIRGWEASLRQGMAILSAGYTGGTFQDRGKELLVELTSGHFCVSWC